jgi:hypothetical protein
MDGEALYRMVSQEDMKRYDLTPTKTRKIIEILLGGLTTAKVVKLHRKYPLPNQAFPREVYWEAEWGEGNSGYSLMGGQGKPLTCLVLVVRTEQGLKVDFQTFLHSFASKRWGRRQTAMAVRWVLASASN